MRSLSICCLITLTAHAQQAPFGSSGGGRHGGSASPVRGAGAEVPLSLPGERHGTPIPLGIVMNGGNTVGEAGVGWSVPLSYVTRATSFARRRPRYLGYDIGPTQPLRGTDVTVELGGTRITMVPIDATHYRSIVDGQTMQLNDYGVQWDLLDGHGRIYHFQTLAGLDDSAHYYLTTITDGGGDAVTLAYNIASRALGGGVSAPEVQLSTIRYNPDNSLCSKHVVTLEWDNPLAPGTTTPLSYSTDAGVLLARAQVVTAVNVQARATSCGDVQTIARYELRYAPDRDTGLPRLYKADRLGRAGSAEASKPMPVGRYWYGSLTRNYAFVGNGPLFQPLPDVQLPAGTTLGQTNGATTSTSIEDVDGDGLPDLIAGSGWYRNNHGASFTSMGNLYAPLSTSQWPAALERQTVLSNIHTAGYSTWASVAAHEDTWTQVIDFNGDGVADILDVPGGDPSHWRLLIHEPGGWREQLLDVSNVINHLYEGGHTNINQGLPLRRTITGQHWSSWSCRTANGAACPGQLPQVSLDDSQRSRVEWKLMDVNGDGYPDLVANRLPSVNHQVQCRFTSGVWPFTDWSTGYQSHCDGEWQFDYLCNSATADSALTPDGRVRCQGASLTSPNYPPSTSMWVFYNRAGALLGGLPSIQPFAGWTKMDDAISCGVEEWVATGGQTYPSSPYYESGYNYTGYLPFSGASQSCGMIDLNGDGLIDRVDEGGVSLGTGEKLIANAAFPRAGSLRVYHSDLGQTCKISPAPPSSTTYNVTQTDGYLDLTGDGIPDYVSGSTVRIGTGSGYTDPFSIQSLPSGFSLSTTLETCGGGSTTTAGLFDLNGDGRPDFVQSAGTTLHVYSLAAVNWNLDPMVDYGALNAGRLIEFQNGSGASTEYRYTNAKLADTATAHIVPFPEIVLERSWTDDQTLGRVDDTTSYKYGGASLWFDAAGDRWSFRGYDRVVVAQGGLTRFVDRYRPGDFGLNSDKNLIAGRMKRTTTTSGTLTGNPLLLDPFADSHWHDQSDVSYGDMSQVINSDPMECTMARQPYGTAAISVNCGLQGCDFDWHCQRTDALYVKSWSKKRGDGSPTGTGFVETAGHVLAADIYGRPTSILHDGDAHRGDDEVCESITWAAPDVRRVLDARSSTRILEPVASGDRCSGATKILSAEHHLYDSLGEGNVGAGLPTAHIVERYDNGIWLDSFQTESITWTPGVAVVDTITTEAGGGQSRQVKLSGWDPFLMVPGTTTTSSGTLPALATHRTVDAYTLWPTEEKDANGAAVDFQFDGYGRPLQTTVFDPATGIDSMVSMAGYLGDTTVDPTQVADMMNGIRGDTLDPAGRRLFARRWHSPVAPSAVNPAPASLPPEESWTITSYDGLGRIRQTQQPLGGDYSGKTLILADRSYDSLGRPSFFAEPYVSGDAAPHYGESWQYRADNVPQCVMRGRGPQTSTDTSPSSGRYSTCTFESFNGYSRSLASRGPAENDPAAAVSNTYDSDTYDALSRLRGRWRQHYAGILQQNLERMDLGYDRLGRLVTTTRYANPNVNGAATTTWTATVDSLGQVTSASEPAQSVRHMLYDRAGHLTEVDWTEGANSRSIAYLYDGYGRATSSFTRTGTSTDSGSTVNYHYDLSSGQPFHQGTDFALGRMTWADSAAQTVYFGYDSLGRTSFKAWVDALGNRVQELAGYRLDGSTARITYNLPDTSFAAEYADFGYDSAQRPKSVRWTDENAPAGIDLFKNATRDPYGRVRAATYGNETSDAISYTDADRNELSYRQLSVYGGNTATSYFSFDDALRLSGRTDNVAAAFGNARIETASYTYDYARRLSTAKVANTFGGALIYNDTYSYDGLGNLTALTDSVSSGRNFTTSVDPADPDRLCRFDVGGTSGSGCNYTWDALGRNLSAQTNLISGRTLSWDGRSRVTQVTNTANGRAVASAYYQYNPFGGVAQLTSNSPDARNDYRYGGNLELSTFTSGGVSSGRFERRVTLPTGTLFVKRGAGAGAVTVYVHREPNGAASVTDAGGRVTENVVYRPFGETRLRTDTNGAVDGWKYLWNDGDALVDFKVEQIGARLYEPRTGRFLSRDPIVNRMSAVDAHPYVFAGGDPISRIDPSGLDFGCIGAKECGGLTNALSIIGLGFAIAGQLDFSWPDSGHAAPAAASRPRWLDNEPEWLSKHRDPNNGYQPKAGELVDDVDAEEFREMYDQFSHSSPLDNKYIHLAAQYAFPEATLVIDILDDRGGPGVDLDKLRRGEGTDDDYDAMMDMFSTAPGGFGGAGAPGPGVEEAPIAPSEPGPVQMVKTSELQPTHGQTSSNRAQARLTENIRDNGMQQSIKFVVEDGKMYVVDGHHRLLAAKKLGLPEVPAQEVTLPWGGYKTPQDLEYTPTGWDDR